VSRTKHPNTLLDVQNSYTYGVPVFPASNFNAVDLSLAIRGRILSDLNLLPILTLDAGFLLLLVHQLRFQTIWLVFWWWLVC